MNALFALALLASSSWAGVVMPVESGVAPAGPSMTAVPVLAPGGGSLGMPALGAADLRGALPLLPAPVPGLLTPALNFFVGEGPRAAAVQAEAAAAPAAPGVAVRSPAAVRRVRAADAAPALPGKPSPGASSLAISVGRTSDPSTSRDGPSNPLLGTSALEHARPEAAAGLGRSFFDQSAEKRGTLEDPSAGDRRSPAGSRGYTAEAGAASAGSASGFIEGAVATRGRLAQRGAGFALGAGHAAPSIGELERATRGETLHDAVAGAPSGAGAAGGAAIFFRSASPNGERSASAGAAALAPPGAPRPLALDLSGSGLIVRVRAALSGAPAAVSAPVPSARLAGPGPSTALLERGGMLEAFSVAADYAARLSLQAVPSAEASAAGAARAPARSVPSPESSPAPLWWAWFALPLFVVAVRGLL